MLGGDEDSFRGENQDVFGPGTEPSSATAGGAWTGTVIDLVSDVVVDSSVVDPDVEWPVLRYAEQMTFRCRRESRSVGSPRESASLDLPGVDLRGSHLLAVDLDSPPDGTLEIVAVGDQGRVFVWNHDLSARRDSEDVPGYLTTGTDASAQPVVWTGAPAAGDVDSDGVPEIVVNAAAGTYIFHADGSELRDGDYDADSYGLAAPVADPDSERHGVPAIVPSAYADDAGAGDLLVATLNTLRFEGQELSGNFYELYDAAGDAIIDVPGMATSFPGLGDLPGPVVWNGRFVAIGSNGDEGYVATPGALTGDGLQVEFSGRPAPWPPLATDDGLLIPMSDGGCIHVGLDGLLAWDNAFPVRSPLSPGIAYATEGGFAKAGRFGAPETSWPVVPGQVVRNAEPVRAVSPLSWREGDRVLTLFAAQDGRLYLYDDSGDAVEGWPVAGPGQTAATPLVMNLDGEPGLEVVAAGTMARLIAHDPGEDAATEPVSKLVVWSLPGTEEAETVWPMWGGSPMRTHQAPASGGALGGDLVESATVSVYPAPARGDRIYARARMNRAGTFMAVLYNLEGEEVAHSSVVPTLAGEPAEAVLNVAHAVTGTYVCRIVASSNGEETIIVKPAAIVR